MLLVSQPKPSLSCTLPMRHQNCEAPAPAPLPLPPPSPPDDAGGCPTCVAGAAAGQSGRARPSCRRLPENRSLHRTLATPLGDQGGYSRAAAADARPLAVRTVKAFLDQRHGRRYRVYNLCSEKTYDPARSAPVPIRPFARALRAQLLGLSPAHTPVSKTGRSQPRKPSQHGKGYSRAGPASRIRSLVHVAAKPVEYDRSASTGNVRHIQDSDQSSQERPGKTG